MQNNIFMTLLTTLFLLQGCSTFEKHYGVNWGDSYCPAPSANQIDQINAGRYLKIEDGKTLKCQIHPYVSNMICQGFTDEYNTDAVMCQSGDKVIFFIFDNNGVLKIHHRRLAP